MTLGAVAGAVVGAAVVGGLVAGGWVVAGVVVGGAVVGAAVVGGAVVAGAVVGGPVDPGGSCGWACAARMLADPASRSPMVVAATTSTRTGRRWVVASTRWGWAGAWRCLGCGASVNSSALKMANFPIHRTPNVSSEAVITIAVVAACDAAAWPARVAPRSAAQVERPRPAKASAQNGTTSFHRWERPRRPQAQLRFR